ncbi:hypothetical protein CRYUN_Cryun32bG0054600 [Craigia yunnanensis]
MACAGFGEVQEGRQIRGLVLKMGVGLDVFVANTLIRMYGKGRYFGVARNLLDRMPKRDVLSWNTLLSAYIETEFIRLARDFFYETEERNREEVRPDNCTLVNMLSACAHLGALGRGEWIHAYINENGIGINGFVATALVDKYSKCGNIGKALKVFRSASRDAWLWRNALEIFSEMLVKGLEPNEVTFIGVLSACSRAGLLNEGHHMFQLMVDNYGIQPTIEHYGCMVDLLGRVDY